MKHLPIIGGGGAYMRHFTTGVGLLLYKVVRQSIEMAYHFFMVALCNRETIYIFIL